jgi:hypothetical protein
MDIRPAPQDPDCRCQKNDLDQHLEQVLRVVADLLKGGVICRCVLDFDADHVGLMNWTKPGRMRFFSVKALLSQARSAHPGCAHRRAAGAQDPARTLVGIAELRRRQLQPLHQASLDVERGWATLRFIDGRIRTAPLEWLPTNGHPGHRLAC